MPYIVQSDAVAQGFGEARLPSAATERRLSAARRCRSPHADGAVVEEIDTIEHSIRVINVVYIVFYAFTAHDRRRIFVARARQPAVRGRRSRHTTIRRPAAPRAHCQSGLQPSRSPSALRLVIQLAHVVVAVHHRTPPSVQSPRLSCPARRACEAVVAVQEELIEEGRNRPN